MFVEVGRAYEDQGVALHFVSLDFPDVEADAVAFLKAQGASLPSFVKIGKDHDFITSVHPRWSGALPATVIYGPKKKLRYFWEQKLDKATLTSALDEVMAGLNKP